MSSGYTTPIDATLTARLANPAQGLGGDAVNLFSGLTARDVIARVPSVAALTALPLPLLAPGRTIVVRVMGYWIEGDGGGGEFRWQGNSNEAHDGATIINPAGNGGAGRWLAVIGDRVSARRWGVKADGATDDTARQQAAIDYCTGKGLHLELAQGVTLVTAMLTVGTPGTAQLQRSFKITGTGRVSTLGKGSIIMLRGIGHEAALKIQRSADRHCVLEDFQVEAETLRGASYGFLYADSSFSVPTFKRLTAVGVGRAYAILKGTGANGEFSYFDNCSAGRVDGFFYMDALSGQAFEPIFVNCSCTLNTDVETALFELGGANGGYGATIIGQSMSLTGSSPFAARPRTTFLKCHGTTDQINVIGGRAEGVTTVLDIDAAPAPGASISFKGYTFAGMGASDTRPIVVSTVNSAAGVDAVWEECQFQLDRNQPTAGWVMSIAASDAGRYVFRRGQITLGGRMHIEQGAQPASEVQFDDVGLLRVNPANGGTIGNARVSKTHRVGGAGTFGRREAHSRDINSAAGIPSQLLVNADFGTTFGANVVAPAPWSHFGVASFTALYGAPNGNANRNSSPETRFVGLGANSGVVADVAGIALASGVPAYYQGLWEFACGAGQSLRIALENSATGQIYDEFITRASSATPVAVSLMAMPGNEGGNLRLRIENQSATALGMHLLWQLCSTKPTATYVRPLPGQTREFRDHWSINADTARVFGRFMLPHKDDVTGSDVAAPQDADADIYLSSVDDRIVHYANGKWWRQTRSTVGAAAPTTGTWALGDIVYHSAPSPGGNVGWICTTAGTPGTWKAFGGISL